MGSRVDAVSVQVGLSTIDHITLDIARPLKKGPIIRRGFLTRLLTMAGVYYAGAIVGPMLGGMFMDKNGPALTVVIANCVVVLGATLQASANGSGQWWMLVLGRIVLGMGGDVTPFATVEILNRLFPHHFMLMAGIRNLIQSGSNFMSIVVRALRLPCARVFWFLRA